MNGEQKRKLDDLHKSALLEHERIVLATEIAGKDEADIEDFFEPELFANLLNATYNLPKSHKLTAARLIDADKGTARLVKKAEAFFRVLPNSIPEFSHFEPSLYLLQHPELLQSKDEAVEKTLARFESAFVRIEKFST